jgi:transcription elongation factor GreA
MARWDDLRRAILARDIDAAERIWLELLEDGPRDPGPFLEMAALLSRQQGGKRDANTLLGLLADAYKQKERWKDLLPVYEQLSGTSPDDGTLRDAVVEAARGAHPDRQDLDTLIERSGLGKEPGPDLPGRIGTLRRLLRIEPGAWVFHKSGWGVGKVAKVMSERGRCLIDFQGRPGHEMDVEAAANLLERIGEDDIRVQAVSDPKGLRERARSQPLEMVRQVVARYGVGARLAHVKDALVPAAVAPSTWSDWWKEARKHALVDSRFRLGTGRDPTIEFHELAGTDFRTQVQAALRAAATGAARLKALRDLATAVRGNEEALGVIVEIAREQLAKEGSGSVRVGWETLIAEVQGADPVEGLIRSLGAAQDPLPIVRGIADADTRAKALRALLARPDGPETLLRVAEGDDPVAAELVVTELAGGEHAALAERLLAAIEDRPAQLPLLYAWAVKRSRRGRGRTRTGSPMDLALRTLRVLDAVAYRSKRAPTAADRRAVDVLVDLLLERSCALLQEAADATDEAGARHLLVILEQNRGLLPRALSKLQHVVLRAWPAAMREAPAATRHEELDPVAGARQLFMTAPGQARLKEEYERITSVEMPDNAREIARAREFGDLRENAEYHAAREKQALLQAKADSIKSDLARAVLITPEVVRMDAVSVGTRVKLRDREGQGHAYTLLGPPDIDPARGVINYLTPLGQALMGARPGDHVKLEVDGAVRELEVLGIENGLS